MPDQWGWGVVLLAVMLLAFTWPAVLKWWRDEHPRFTPDGEYVTPVTKVQEAVYSVLERSLRVEPELWEEKPKGYLRHQQTGISIKMWEGSHLLTVARKSGEVLTPPRHWREKLWWLGKQMIYQREQEATLDHLDNVLADFERRS